MWTGAGPERSGASPLSPRKPSSAATHPQAGDLDPLLPPEPPRAAWPWCFAPQQRHAGAAALARPDPAQCSAPRLKGERGKRRGGHVNLNHASSRLAEIRESKALRALTLAVSISIATCWTVFLI